MDDARELKKLAIECEGPQEECLRQVKFEHTGRDSPQINSMVERKVAVVAKKIKATLNAAMLDKKKQISTMGGMWDV